MFIPATFLPEFADLCSGSFSTRWGKSRRSQMQELRDGSGQWACAGRQEWTNKLPLLLDVVFSCSCSNIEPPTGWAANERHLSSPGYGAAGLKSSHGQGCALSDGSRAGSFQASSWLWCLPAILGFPWFVDAPFRSLPGLIRHSLCVWCHVLFPPCVSVFGVDIHLVVVGRGRTLQPRTSDTPKTFDSK